MYNNSHSSCRFCIIKLIIWQNICKHSVCSILQTYTIIFTSLIDVSCNLIKKTNQKQNPKSEAYSSGTEIKNEHKYISISKCIMCEFMWGDFFNWDICFYLGMVTTFTQILKRCTTILEQQGILWKSWVSLNHKTFWFLSLKRMFNDKYIF
jgi:hypothetical protein